MQKGENRIVESNKSTNDSYYEFIVDSIPSMVSVNMEVIMMTINLHYATSAEMSAGLGLSMILIHSLGGSVIIGFNSGYSVFASRAYGAGQKTRYYRFYLQALFNLFVLLIVFSLLGLISYKVSIWTGQEESIAAWAYRFYVYQLPGFWLYFNADLLRSFLNTQAVFRPIFISNGSACVLHVVYSTIFNKMYPQYGIIISTNLTLATLFFITLAIQCNFSTWKLDLNQLKKAKEQLFEGYQEFLRECAWIALPFTLDLFFFEIMALWIGSYQYVEQTAAHINFSNIVMNNGSVMFGYATTAMAKIGHSIGENDHQKVSDLIRKSLIIGTITIQGLYLLLCLFSSQIFSFYTDDQSVQELMHSILLPYFFYCYFDMLMFIGSHIFRSFNDGEWVTKIFTLSYYGLGLTSMPILCYFLANKLVGVWIAFTLGSFSITINMYLRWKQIEVKQITNRLHQAMKQESTSHQLQMPIIYH